MSEIQVRLAQLRAAADGLTQSGHRLHQSALAVQDVIQELNALGLLAESAALVPQVQAGHLWLDTLWVLADGLSRAANDIEGAMQARLPHFATGMLPFHLWEEAPSPAAAAADNPPLPGHITYVSSINRPLYDELQLNQTVLVQQEEALQHLQADRDQAASNLLALQNRLRSLDPTIDVGARAEVQALQARVTTLDDEIAATGATIDGLQDRVNTLTARLVRVSPGAGADLDVIHALENTRSAPWLSANTYDCVRHVVERMPVPGTIARDAALWVEIAAGQPQYGISVGQTPLAGSVLVLQPAHPYADDLYGHVMYVERVEGDAVWITDNVHPTEPVRLSDLVSDWDGETMTYLYFPWHTRA